MPSLHQIECPTPTECFLSEVEVYLCDCFTPACHIWLQYLFAMPVCNTLVFANLLLYIVYQWWCVHFYKSFMVGVVQRWLWRKEHVAVCCGFATNLSRISSPPIWWTTWSVMVCWLWMKRRGSGHRWVYVSHLVVGCCLLFLLLAVLCLLYHTFFTKSISPRFNKLYILYVLKTNNNHQIMKTFFTSSLSNAHLSHKSLSLSTAHQEGSGCGPAGASPEEGQQCLHLLLQLPGQRDI